MALSGVRDGSETAGDIVTAALRKIHVLEGGETAEAEDMSSGLATLRRMLRSWSAVGVRLWLNEEQAITLAANTASYELGPRLIEVTGAYRRSGTNDTPINMMARDGYMRLTNKSASGAPYAFWFDRNLNTSRIVVYPVPSEAGDEIIVLGKRAVQDVEAITDNMEVPPQWSEAIVYNLALRLAPEFDAEVRPDVSQMASELYAVMAGQDREGSLRMRPRVRR